MEIGAVKSTVIVKMLKCDNNSNLKFKMKLLRYCSAHLYHWIQTDNISILIQKCITHTL